MLEAVPCQVSNIRTNNGIQFSNNSKNQIAIYSQSTRFAMICERAFEKPCGCLGSHGDAAPFIGAIVSAGGYAGLCDHRAPVRLARQGSTRRLLKHALMPTGSSIT
jgi:hypothetical protein